MLCYRGLTAPIYCSHNCAIFLIVHLIDLLGLSLSSQKTTKIVGPRQESRAINIFNLVSAAGLTPSPELVLPRVLTLAHLFLSLNLSLMP